MTYEIAGRSPIIRTSMPCGAREFERRVAERTRTIENTLRHVEAFNAMVSHDLRAPPQVIAMTRNVMKNLLGNA